MDRSARQYARRILLVHVAVMVAVVVLVAVTAQRVYAATQKEAIEQARRRQVLLANQTARGVEAFYASVLSDLELLRRAETDQPREAPAIAGLLWRQLQGRTAALFTYDKPADATRVIGDDLTGPGGADVAQVVGQSRAWLRGVELPAVSRSQALGRRRVNLVCVPVGPRAERVLVAVVPIDEVDRRFLGSLNEAAGTGATLVDESLAALATYDARGVGGNVTDLSDVDAREMVQQIIARGRPDSFVLDRPTTAGAVRFKPSIVVYEPVRFADKQWNLFVASSLGEVDEIVANVFRQTALWAAIVAVAMTATLVSTSVSMIRNRYRLERMRHELLTRELDQARRIQLNWLPEQHADRPEVVCRRGSGRAIDIAAVNLPASHVSGDFYNWFELDDGRVVVTIGDVTGHGTSAALLMATAQLLVRTAMQRSGGDPGRCLTDVNRQLCSQVFSGQFITMACLVLDVVNGTLEVANAGHPPPLVGDGTGTFRELAVEAQLVLAIDAEVEFRTQRFALPPRAEVVLYTDGAVEAASPTGERYTPEQFRAALAGPYASAQTLLDAAVRAVNDFRKTAPLADDLTVVAVQLQDAAEAAEKPAIVQA